MTKRQERLFFLSQQSCAAKEMPSDRHHRFREHRGHASPILTGAHCGVARSHYCTKHGYCALQVTTWAAIWPALFRRDTGALRVSTRKSSTDTARQRMTWDTNQLADGKWARIYAVAFLNKSSPKAELCHQEGKIPNAASRSSPFFPGSSYRKTPERSYRPTLASWIDESKTLFIGLIVGVPGSHAGSDGSRKGSTPAMGAREQSFGNAGLFLRQGDTTSPIGHPC